MSEQQIPPADPVAETIIMSAFALAFLVIIFLLIREAKKGRSFRKYLNSSGWKKVSLHFITKKPTDRELNKFWKGMTASLERAKIAAVKDVQGVKILTGLFTISTDGTSNIIYNPEGVIDSVTNFYRLKLRILFPANQTLQAQKVWQAIAYANREDTKTFDQSDVGFIENKSGHREACFIDLTSKVGNPSRWVIVHQVVVNAVERALSKVKQDATA